MSDLAVDRPTPSTRAGGVALVAGAIGFIAVFSYLAARFDYPAVLDGPAASVLPALLATGSGGRAAWAFYGLLPLIWLPAGVGAYQALRRTHPGAMLLALQFAVLSAVSMMLGLMRWPTIHWRLAQLYVQGTPEEQRLIAAVFDSTSTPATISVSFSASCRSVRSSCSARGRSSGRIARRGGWPS